MHIDDLAAAPPADLIAGGGWSPQCVRVLRVETVQEEALVLIDTNGDGGDVSADVWHRDAEGTWSCCGSHSLGPRWHVGASRLVRVRLLWTIGRALGRQTVQFAHGNDVDEVAVDEHGYWVVTDEDLDSEKPFVIA